jgi:hypothetical protein
VKPVVAGLIAAVILSILIMAGVWWLAVGIPYQIAESQSALEQFCQWIYDSKIGTDIRESLYFFPLIEGLHLLGIALSVGVLCWFDLRLMGLALRDQPVSKVWRQVMPTAFVGFALMFVTGILLFWAEAATAYHSIHFWIKIALLAAAGVNALLFEATAHRHMAAWDTAPVPPFRARLTGFLSLIFWTAIIITGRTMAYTF